MQVGIVLGIDVATFKNTKTSHLDGHAYMVNW